MRDAYGLAKYEHDALASVIVTNLDASADATVPDASSGTCASAW